MNRLALIGKSIGHSNSPAIYQKLLGGNVDYKLLDYQSEAEIPTLAELFSKYQLDGLSITAPFKKVFLPQVVLDESVKSLGLPGINCIRRDGDRFVATNTDFFAIQKQMDTLELSKKSKIIILGDGVMSQITQVILEKRGIVFQLYSRRQNGHINNLDFSQIENLLLINACGRGFQFGGKLNSSAIFWDYNYDNGNQGDLVSKQNALYLDGNDLLFNQAVVALIFWNLKKD